MSKRSFVETGLGYGDEGKGTTTHWFCMQYRAHTVVRTGGPQAFHRVVTAGGEEFVHSQFGSGTLVGASTHLSRKMVIEPVGILNEGGTLMYEHGIRNIFDYLTIHEDALVVTPSYAAANRLRELARGTNRYGTVGMGVGEAVLDAELFGDTAIRARDLASPLLREKLEVARQQKITELQELITGIGALPEAARAAAEKETRLLLSESKVDWTVAQYNAVAAKIRIVGTEFLADNILRSNGAVVFEPSQGVLLDRWYGFHPHTTKVRAVPELALSLLEECNYDGEVVRIGILRAYHTKHGAGPFVSECPTLTKQLPDVSNGNHPWQGSFRIGNLDIVAARYAIQACGGANAFHGLVVTCMDRVFPLGTWNLCTRYAGFDTDEFFEHRDGLITGIKVRHGTGDAQLKRQEALCRNLLECRPVVSSFKIPAHMTQEEFIQYCAKSLSKMLDVPIMAASLGPTEKDKIVIVG